MPITALDSNTALIIIDLQQGIVANAAQHSADRVVANAARLAESFRAKQLPVVLVNVVGIAPGRAEQVRHLNELPSAWFELVPALNCQPQDHLVSKRSWGAFSNTDLALYLKQHGVTQVVLAGISTSIGVETTARQAYEMGLNVTLALDAMTDANPEAHAHSVMRIFPRLGETGTTEEILTVLSK